MGQQGMVVGVKKVVCTCGGDMVRTGGTFGGAGPTTDTYYCPNCEKPVIVLTPKVPAQKEFTRDMRTR